MFFINAIYWLGIFIVPAGILGFVALWLYFDSPQNLIFSIIISVVGISLGIALAEYIRKRYGLDSFHARLMATPDIDGGNILDEKAKEYDLKRQEKKNRKKT